MSAEGITGKNLKRLCWLNGLSIVGLARAIGKHPTTVHRAVRRPNQYQPTYRQIAKALRKRF